MSKTVGKLSEAVEAMREAARTGRTLMAGTKAMREAATTYLPRFKAEDPEDYKARLEGSWLFNGFKKTVKDMTGQVLDTPVEIVDPTPELELWEANIDLQGNDLSSFAKKVFKDCFVPGVSYIMVDAPRREATVTRAQARDMNLRPYMSHLTVEDILGWKTTKIGNQTVLSQIRIVETYEVEGEDEFAEEKDVQIRVLTRGDRLPDSDKTGVSVRIYRRPANNSTEWELFDEYMTEAEEITVVPVYGQRSGFMTGEPVLEDLADVNIAHWQSQSDQRYILRMARVPILFASGIEADTAIKVSASSAVKSNNPDAKLQWVEHSGGAIGAGRQDLKDLEFQMETLGLQLLVKTQKTATGSALDAKKETSTLSEMADSLKDAIETALRMMLDYAGAPGEVSVNVNTDFGLDAFTVEEIKTLQNDVSLGYLSLEEYYAERKRRGLLREDLDIEADREKVAVEGLTDPGAEDDDG